MKNYCFNSNIYIHQKEAKWKATEINTVRKVLKATKTQRYGLTIRLSNDKDVTAFNLKWKGINKSTNILSFLNNDQIFSIENNKIYLGDIIVSYDTLLKEVTSLKLHSSKIQFVKSQSSNVAPSKLHATKNIPLFNCLDIWD